MIHMCACTPALRKKTTLLRIFSRSAPEHAYGCAAYEWRTAGYKGIFTAARAKTVPQTDRLGKGAVWITVQTLMAQNLIPNKADGAWLDITDGQMLKWWLWVSNLGPYMLRVIGTGVRKAYVAVNTQHEVVFKFVRASAEDPFCILRLRRHGRSGELQVHM